MGMRVTALLCVLVLVLGLCVSACVAQGEGSVDPLRFYFNLIDQDGDAALQPEELWAYIQGLMHDDDDQPSRSVVPDFLRRYDSNRDQQLTWAEFLDAFRSLGPPTSAPGSGLGNAQTLPQQIHIMLYGGSPDTANIMWVTDEETPLSVVQLFRSATGPVEKEVQGQQYTYDVGILGGWHKFIHLVQIRDLPADTPFFYRVGDGVDSWSLLYSFRTDVLPDQTHNAYPARWAVFGDQGTTIPLGFAVTDQIVQDHNQEPFSAIMVAGDLSYAGTGGGWEYEPVWDVYGRQMEKIAAYVPMITVVGNHESFYNYTAFRLRYRMPGYDMTGGEGNFWFSVNRGPVHFTAMSTEHDYSVGSPQYKFLESDLAQAAANRAQRPWILLSGHRPMYCSDEFENDQAQAGTHFQRTIEPLLQKYQVDLAIWGHHHVYERTFPMNNGTADMVGVQGNEYHSPRYTVHVVQGTGGAVYPDKWVERPAWSASRSIHYGYGHVQFANATAMRYQFRKEEGRKVEDEFWIYK